MATVCHPGFQKVGNFKTAGPVRKSNMHHQAKFSADRSNHCRVMAAFSTFQDGVVRHLRFLKVRNFDCGTCSRDQCASTCKITCWLREQLRRYDRFRFFKMAAVCHLGFWKVRIFNCPSGTESQYALPSQISYRSVELLQRRGLFSVFQDCGVRHLEFLKVRNFIYRSDRKSHVCVSMPHFVPIGQTFAEIWPIIDFSRWRPSTILDLFYVYLDHPQRAFVGLCHYAKCGFNRCSNFDGMPVLIFCEFGLKMPIPPFLGGFWGIWPPRWDTISTNLTKVSSTGHSGSSGILLMLVSIVVPEKLPGQKRCEVEEAEEEHEFWGVSDVFLK